MRREREDHLKDDSVDLLDSEMASDCMTAKPSLRRSSLSDSPHSSRATLESHIRVVTWLDVCRMQGMGLLTGYRLFRVGSETK